MAKTRKEFKDIYKWNVTDLYKNDKEALKEIKNLEKDILTLDEYKGHILDSADSLFAVLNNDTLLEKRIERIYTYGHINNDADTKDVNFQTIYGLARNIYTKYLEHSSYIVPELLKGEYDLVLKYIKENKNLKPYERTLKHIFRNKEHILSEEVESALASYANLFSAPDEIMQTLSDSDFSFDSINVDGKEVELTESNYSVYIKNPNRDVRLAAFNSFHKTYSKFKNTIATILKNEVEKNVANAKLRKFNSSLEASLFPNEIDTKVYHNLISGVHKHLPSLYKYWELKRKELNLEEMHIYDTYADISKKDHKKYTFEEAKDLVLKAVEPLGEGYQKDILQAFTKGWIDSCNNEGKRGGAYCTACYEVHPYVLLSFENDMQSVSTLAHELGHAMHYYYACQNQSYQDYGYSIFVAEVASQTNEILLNRYLLDHASSKSEKLKIIDNLLLGIKASIFRQTMFAEFELFIHEYTEKGNVLTYENMIDKYYELNKLYFGPKVICDDLIKYEWERIPHFYLNFYVYQYATSFTAAISLANKIYDGDIETRDKYLEFLKLGCTKNPIDSLKVAGIDMTTNKVLDDAIKFMDELLEMYEELQGSDKA